MRTRCLAVLSSYAASRAEHTKEPSRVAAGLKAAMHNPNVSEEARERAAERLKEMERDAEVASEEPQHPITEESTRVLAGYKATLSSECHSQSLFLVWRSQQRFFPSSFLIQTRTPQQRPKRTLKKCSRRLAFLRDSLGTVTKSTRRACLRVTRLPFTVCRGRFASPFFLNHAIGRSPRV